MKAIHMAVSLDHSLAVNPLLLSSMVVAQGAVQEGLILEVVALLVDLAEVPREL